MKTINKLIGMIVIGSCLLQLPMIASYMKETSSDCTLAQVDEMASDLKTAKSHIYMAGDLANKWYDRGEIEFAFKLDKLHNEVWPGVLLQRAKVWLKRGYADKAEDLSILYVDEMGGQGICSVLMWYSRPEVDPRVAKRLEEKFLKKYPTWNKQFFNCFNIDL